MFKLLLCVLLTYHLGVENVLSIESETRVINGENNFDLIHTLVVYDSPVPIVNLFLPTNVLTRCTGTLISKNVVVTAGHCLEKEYQENPGYNVYISNPEIVPLSVQFISWLFNRPILCGAPVLKSTRHPDYKLVNDPVAGQSAVSDSGTLVIGDFPSFCTPKPAKLVQRNNEVPVGTHARQLGYGLTNTNLVVLTSQTLKSANVSVISNEAANAAMGTDVFIDDTVLPAYGEKKGPCSGDSGGALMLTFRILTQIFYVLIGSTTAGDCEYITAPGLYAKLSNPSLHDFILSSTPCGVNNDCVYNGNIPFSTSY